MSEWELGSEKQSHEWVLACGREGGGEGRTLLYGGAFRDPRSVGRDARAAPVSLSLLQVICRRVLMGSFTDSHKAALMAKVILTGASVFRAYTSFPPLLWVPVLGTQMGFSTDSLTPSNSSP